MYNAKILNYMLRFVNCLRLSLWLVAVALVTFALSITSCRQQKQMVSTSSSLTISKLQNPKVVSISNKWTIPKQTFDSMLADSQILSMVDTTSKVGLHVYRTSVGNITLEPFAFVPGEFCLQDIQIKSSADSADVSHGQNGGQPHWIFSLLIIICLLLLVLRNIRI